MRDFDHRPAVFIATLGNAPQVVTLALDLLLRRQKLVEVCVIHTDANPAADLPHMRFSTMAETVKALDAEFQNPRPLPVSPGQNAWQVDYPTRSGYTQFVYRRVLIQRMEERPGQLPQAVPVRDVETEANAHAAFRTIYQTVRTYKEQRARIHFCMAGGRKSMALFGMASAQLLFTPGDQLWHLVSRYEFMATQAMHDDREMARLVPIPFISLSTVNPVMGTLISTGDPYDVVQAQENYLQLVDLSRKERFLRQLDYDEYQILVGVAQGLSNAEIGARLEKTLAAKTVANKLTTVYETYMVALSDVPTDVTRTNSENMRAFLAAEFGAYFRQRGAGLSAP